MLQLAQSRGWLGPDAERVQPSGGDLIADLVRAGLIRGDHAMELRKAAKRTPFICTACRAAIMIAELPAEGAAGEAACCVAVTVKGTGVSSMCDCAHSSCAGSGSGVVKFAPSMSPVELSNSTKTLSDPRRAMPSDDAGTTPEAYAETPAIATQPTAAAVAFQEKDMRRSRPEPGRRGESSLATAWGIMV